MNKIRAILTLTIIAPLLVLFGVSPASAATCNNPDSGYKYQTWTESFDYAIDTGQQILNTHTATKTSTIRYKTCGTSPNVKVRPFYSRIDVTWNAGADASYLSALGEDQCVAGSHYIHSLQLGYLYETGGLCLPAPTSGVSSVTIPIDVGTDNWLLQTYEPVWSGYLYSTTSLITLADNPLNFTTSAGIDYRKFKPGTDPSGP